MINSCVNELKNPGVSPMEQQTIRTDMVSLRNFGSFLTPLALIMDKICIHCVGVVLDELPYWLLSIMEMLNIAVSLCFQAKYENKLQPLKLLMKQYVHALKHCPTSDQ